MKYLLLVLSVSLAGCAADGSFDGKAFSEGLRAVNETYSTYDRAQHPERYPIYRQPGYYQP